MPTPSTSPAVYDSGFRDGVERGRLEGACRQLRKLLLRLGRQRLGPPTPEAEAALDHFDSLLARECFHTLADRLSAATDWTSWTAAAPSPGAVPPLPDYLEDYHFDPTPPAAGFDMSFKASLLPGKQLPQSSRIGKAGHYDTSRVIVHMRFQKWHEPNLDRLIYKANRELREAHRIDRVESILFLLFEMADGPGVTGKHKVSSFLGKKPTETFHYQVVRVWEKPPEELLHGGFGVAMMAPLSRVTEQELPDIIRRMHEVCVRSGQSEDKIASHWDAVYWFMGFRYPADLVNRLLEPHLPLVRKLKTYRSLQADGFFAGRAVGEAEGVLQATRDLIVRLETARLGAPSAEARQAVESLSDLEELERRAGRALAE